MKHYCIADYKSATAFRLLNIPTYEANAANQALKVFHDIVKMEDAGIILITDSVANMIRQELVRFTAKNTIPIVLEIPSYEGAVSGIGKEHE
ncbi:MAG TPA: V-type ATP synthase subunit F [bacterium]|nr:V-type ATP synthase subunit F [bacterium]HOL35633.1 V-type ATP synthase subunit F [bacterium]HPP08920.1 V-type ATP synthase subunit F [bacterium]